ncbi:MAG: substrate-binding domain-containing protein [bacterium]|nr:substrate-binding domain-containing protein [bacterium]
MSAAPRVALQINTSTGFSSQLIRGVVQYAQEHQRWSLLVQPRGVRERWRIPQHWRPDGVIARVTQRSQARELQKLGVPVINVSRSVVSGFSFSQVVADEHLVGGWAADYLLERGFNHFAYLGLVTQPHYTDTCGLGFTERLKSQGHTCAMLHTLSAGGRARKQLTFAEMKRWLTSLPLPVGIFAADIESAYAVTDACWSCGLNVPESVAVLCGEDDPLLAEISNPPLSCIDADPRRVGYEAAEQLDLLLSGKNVSRSVRLVPALGVVERRSTDTVAFDDPLLAAAVRYIRESATTPIDVSDVLKKVPVSRRALEQRFQRHLGRTPAAEIRRIRLIRVQELLRDTDWPMPRIARAAGFSSTEVMNQVFRRERDQTPTQYRRQSRSHAD